MKTNPAVAILLSLALAGPLAAQAPDAGKGGAKQKGKKEFREPTWKMPPVEGPNLHYKTFDSKTAGEPVSLFDLPAAGV